jgi:DNA-binding NtrC family response regulator
VSLSLLIVDDDTTTGETLAKYFTNLGYLVRVAASAAGGRRAAADHSPDVALIDFRLPDAEGSSLITALLADDPDLAVIVLTGHADIRTAVRAMRVGAADLVEKPVDTEALREAVDRAAERARLKRELDHIRAREAAALGDMVAWTSPSLDKLIDLAAHNADVPVLILGERGTGKSVIARRIHARSPRADSAFVAVNCGSLAPPSLDDAVFGHERGAQDARRAKRGLLEVARGGTLFLDEIAELAPGTQPKLLTVIEDGIFHRVGGSAVLRGDARIMAATNAPLRDAVAVGRFRPDLFYRLQVLTIELAPLRERRAEIPRLLDSLLPRGAKLSDAGRRAIEAYDWPGNVRELKNALWRAAVLADGQQITPAHLALGVAKAGMLKLSDSALTPHANADVFTIADAERRAIVDALHATGGNKLRAAQLLGIARSTLLEKVRRFGLA